MVIPLGECAARPPQDGRSYPLIAHLEAVARGCGDPHGDLPARLSYLGGLLHDAGKAAERWQKEMLAGKQDLPLHSWIGAYLYAYTVRRILEAGHAGPLGGSPRGPQAPRPVSPGVAAWVVRTILDVADHHSVLGDVDGLRAPWKAHWNDQVWFEMDLNGLRDLVRQHLPDFPELPTAEELASRQEKYSMERLWHQWTRAAAQSTRAQVTDQARSVLRLPTARLIAADRCDAAGITEQELSPAEAASALRCLEEALAAKQRKAWGTPQQTIAEMRARVAERVARRFEGLAPDQRVVALELPTGLGKTLLGLRLALWSAAQRRARRVVYVAPYLSILSQAAKEIQEVTGLGVLEHHHLSALKAPPFSQAGHEDLTLESWQAPVVATTFNQFVRGLFPATAQQSMRLAALQRAFIIIDEPQIMEPGTWNLMLSFLGAAIADLDSRLLLMSATMPPLAALGGPLARFDAGEKPLDRFVLRSLAGHMDISALAAEAFNQVRAGHSTAVILNTIKDTVLVFEACQHLAGRDPAVLLCLHGAMTPLHKHHQIEKIRRALEEGRAALVVSTQAIEAGVDLSFRRIYRARPVLPSVVQAAGRANRHAEGGPAPVYVFDFRRGSQDTRPFVYRNAVAREVTDALLPASLEIGEAESYARVNAYFKEFFARSPAEGDIQRLAAAAAGQWTQLAQVKVFDDTLAGQEVAVFVPWGARIMPEYVRAAMEGFGLRDPEDLYRHYVTPGWMAKLDFSARKRFMALLLQFVVPLSFKVARRVAAPDEERSIWRLADINTYSDTVGLGGVLAKEEETQIW
ncbi:MAG: CRISPR-associated helicase Cas3' [Firmicutes bacterium]|nr:CRISPR-associated helicase Cas3' [Bacillota bacterium]